MKTIRHTLLVLGLSITFCIPPSQANLIEQDVELPTCQLHLRHTHAIPENNRPLFVMVEGVPLSALIYRKLALTLVDKLNAQAILIDFPGLGKSRLKGESYTWADHRICLASYLATLPPHIIISSDIATPVLAPLMHQPLPIRGMVITNSVVKPSETRPPFPMSFFRCCPEAALNASKIIPNFVLRNRIMEVGIGREATVDFAEITALSKEMHTNGYIGLSKIMPGIALDESTDTEVYNALTTTLPLLYIWGTLDEALGDHYKYLPARKTNQQLLLYPQARHYPMLDHPQEMAADITGWYKQHFTVEVNAQN